MRRPPRPLVLALALPFLTACVTPQVAPVPSPQDREGIEVRGVAIGDPEDGGSTVEFAEVYEVAWGASELTIQGVLVEDEASGNVVRRSFEYVDISGILTNQVDVNRTSLVVAGVMFVAIATVVFFFTERTGGRGPAPATGG